MANFSKIIVDTIANLRTRVRKLEKEAGISDRGGLNDAYDDVQDAPIGMPGSSFSRYFYFPTEVASAYSDESLFTGKILIPTTTTSKWTFDTSLTGIITVDVPANMTVPSVGDKVVAMFTGTYGTSPARSRYMMAGAGGGSKQCKIVSVYDDYLGVVSIIASTEVGSAFEVAKPYVLRKEGFDGETVKGVTYVYSTNETRKATIAASTALFQTEFVIPTWEADDIIVAIGIDSTNVWVNSVELKLVDNNNSFRQWVRKGI